MGDMADHLLEQMEDGWWRGPKRKTLPPLPVCKYCGAKNLVWHQNEDGAWRLHTRGGNPHNCPNVKCKFCGKAGLRWLETHDGWRLRDGGDLHSCKEHPNAVLQDLRPGIGPDAEVRDDEA